MEMIMRRALYLFFVVFLLIIRFFALHSDLYINNAAVLLVQKNQGQEIPIYYSSDVEKLAQKAISLDPENATALRFISLLKIAERLDKPTINIIKQLSISDELLRRRGLLILKTFEKAEASSICEDSISNSQFENSEKGYLASLGVVGVRYLKAAGSLEYPYYTSLLDLLDFYQYFGMSNNSEKVVSEIEQRLIILERLDQNQYEDAINKGRLREKVVQNILWGTYWSMEHDRREKDWDSVISKSNKILSVDSQFPFVNLSLAEAYFYSGDCTKAELWLNNEFNQGDISIAFNHLGQCELQKYEQSPNVIHGHTTNFDIDSCNVKWNWDRLVIWRPISDQSLNDSIN
jgi:hypothetical protein